MRPIRQLNARACEILEQSLMRRKPTGSLTLAIATGPVQQGDQQQVIFIAPGLALVSLVIGLNLFADGLRDIADPTRRRSR